MSKEQQRPQKVDRTKTQAFRAGFMTGYTNDNPASDASINGYFAGYVGTRPKAQKAGK